MANLTYKKIDWNKEYVKYVKNLQKTPKFKGFSYPCLASMKKVRKKFQTRKKQYLEKLANQYSYGGGGRGRRLRRGGSFLSSFNGVNPPPDPRPFMDQLQSNHTTY